MPRLRSPRGPLFVVASFLLAACSGGGGGGAGGGPFVLTGTNVSNNVVWPLNRAIVFTFSHRVDPATVDFASVPITSAASPPVTGTFFVDPCSDGSVVVFQPDCPSNDALDDGGLKPGGVNYTLTVRSGAGPNVIQDTGGKRLASGITVNFKSPTPPVEQPLIDPQPAGPPVPSPLGLASIGLNTFTAPVNPILVTFDQPVDPRSSNLNAQTPSPAVQLQFEDPPFSGAWILVPSTLTLVSNCVPQLGPTAPCPFAENATIAIAPTGILPQGRNARVVVKAGFRDIGGAIGQQTNQDTVLALFPIEAADPAPGEGDAFHEEFDDTANRDATSPLTITTGSTTAPLAEWGNGVLRAREAFPAPLLSGAAQFNLNVASGPPLILDTTLDQLTGTDGNGAPALLNVTGGVVNLHNLTVQAGGRIDGQGPNPLVFNCTGSVTIGGASPAAAAVINVDGDLGTDVLPNSADVTQPGAPGECGGGKGGDSSPDNEQSSQRGGDGAGPGNLPGLGGRGGHSCFGTVGAENRRGAGGGGGSFATAAAAGGGPGGPQGTDALTGSGGATGGDVGPTAFANAIAGDEFFGLKLVNPGGTILVGELASLRGGSGGGAGGDSVAGGVFPNPAFASGGITGDKQGGRGGGGGGVLVIRCVGAFTLNATGVLSAKGGGGGDGESTSGISPPNRIGGGGGGGSGGMVVIESLTSITIATGVANNERIRVKGGAGGLGAGTTANAGGVGGDGIVQLNTPTVNGTGQPTVISGATPVTSLPTNTADILPAAVHLILPAFSRISRARTRWINTGFTTLGNAGGPFYEWVVSSPPGSVPNDPTNGDYPLLDATGAVRASAGSVVNPPAISVGDVPIGSVGLQSITIPLAALSAAGFLNPAAMRGFELNPNTGQAAQTFTIVSGTTSGTNAVFSTDPADGAMTGVLPVAATTPVAIAPRFFLVRTAGVENALPTGATVRVLFEGATSVSSTGVVSGSTGLTASLSALLGKPFFRAQVEFDLTGLGAASSTLARPELEFLKLPIRF
ncbi:MAG TPA: Ig-like domain-containing protein [Planctomycetota bacterium]|jgi:hypothetical protein|nr:Ig-like domain-containing protein [Planctomycetota bacterium]